MKKPVLAFFLIIILLLALPVCAEIYKYTDEDGQKRWTDDLSQVPKEQRPSAQRFESVEETTADAAAGQTQKVRPGSPPETVTAHTDADEPLEADKLNRKALEKEKADLDSQYRQLLEERKQIEQIKPEATSASTRAELNRRISEYNSKTEQYESRLNAFNEKINAFNKKLMAKPSKAGE